ncbi:MAG TPA: hypothetical protein V6D15_05935 [Oculatellaceae cyanobacterium]|jgi:hypothetical protein
MARLIPVEMIPNSLWNKEDFILHLPPQLISSWEMLLDKYQLREKASTEAPEGFEGGMSKEDTDNHLAWRFTGSSARVMLTMLDPLQELPQIPDVFARIFSGNKVFLADLPCGSGAASMSILSVLYELRKQGKLPRMPIHIVIVGGEISEYAQNYAKEAIDSITTELEAQAITLEFDIMDWDVCDKFSNTDLINQLRLRSQNCSAKLLVLANFSGFLEKEKKWKEASKQFDELFRHSRSENSVALWIEPSMKKVTYESGFFTRLIDWFKKLFSKLIEEDKEIEQKRYDPSNPVRVKHPLVEGTFRTNVAVVRLELPLRKKKQS